MDERYNREHSLLTFFSYAAADCTIEKLPRLVAIAQEGADRSEWYLSMLKDFKSVKTIEELKLAINHLVYKLYGEGFADEDPRKTGLKNGLRQLTVEQINRVINYSGEMVLDSYNYENGKFCPLAVALELDKTMVDPTHDKVFQTLTDLGYKVYNTRGILGKFYTNNRKEDLIQAAREVLEEKLQHRSDLEINDD